MFTPVPSAEKPARFFNSLRKKLVLMFLITSLIPLSVIGFLTYFQAKNALETEITDKLTAIRDLKAKQIKDYFRERVASLKAMANNPSTLEAFKAFEAVVHPDQADVVTLNSNKVMEAVRPAYLNRPNLINVEDGSPYSAAHSRYHPIFKQNQEAFGYYDLFFVELHRGLIVYSVTKEDDFGTSLMDGPYANTNLGIIFKKIASATEANSITFVDFVYHEPSKSYAAFMGAPVFDQSKLVGIMIWQITTAPLDAIMQTHVGLGATGETILVSTDDFLLRSNSRFSPENMLFKIKADTQDNRAAAGGETGFEKTLDYRGVPVISAYTPLNIVGMRWLLDAKMDVAEAFSPMKHLLYELWLLMGLGAIIVSAIAFFISNSITKPIRKVTKVARQLAAGDMTQIDIKIKGRDEIALMVGAFRQMTLNLHRIIEDIVHISQSLAEGTLQATYTANYQGDLRQIEESINIALYNLRQQVTDIVQITQELAKGTVEVTPQAKYRGDFIKIKDALETTAVKLAEVMNENAQQDWLKTGLAQLDEGLRGEQEITSLSKKIIDFLVIYLDVPVGLLYLVKDTDKPDTYLQKTASYGYTLKKGSPNRFLLGEGLVGQTALEKKVIVRDCLPEESTPIIQSNLVQALPRYVLFVPFLYEETVKGVVELGSAEPFSAAKREFLDQAMPNVGIAFQSAESRDRLHALLQHSQTQAKELQAQQETLQQVNEELQAQTEELQTQQEELRHSNEELAVRTQELERQKAEIREKNISLEKARQVVENKAQELELASKYKSEFLANMSHELRTPLNSLLMLAQLLAENKKGNLTEKQLEYVSTIYSAGSDLLNLINDILDLSKIEAGKIEIITEEVSLSELVKTTEQKFRHIAQSKGLNFELTVAENLPAVLITDGQRLKQIITNLLSNALKFTAHGSVQLVVQRPLEKEVATLGLDPATTVAIKVVDSGIGIPKEKQKLIFEAFQQADGTTSRRYGGTGLGLSISRQLARLLGGDLTVTSEPEKGSVFTLHIPEVNKEGAKRSGNHVQKHVDIQEDTLPFLPEAVNSSATDDRNNLLPEDKIILIIEDDNKLANVLMELAQEKGFKCLRAEDGKIGLQLVQEHKPLAIVLDIGLPQMDGWTVMEKLKADPQTRPIPVHFISASDQSVDAKRMGAIGYSLKPVSIAEVGETFRKIEQFITKNPKQVLVVVDETQRQQQIKNLLENETTTLFFAATRETAFTHLHEVQFDCIIVDIEAEQNTGLGLLDYLQTNRRFSQIPSIVYTERTLNSEESNRLEHYANNLPVKTAQSPARLLDEVTLFLHQVSTRFPEETPLKVTHDKESLLTSKRVLIVDDDSRNVFALTVALDDKGMLVSNCENGQQALDFLAEHSDIHLILMDIMMPEMDGYETIRKIRAQPQFHKLPIIALTAKAMKNDKAKCIEAGANDYLAKPVDIDRLISLMRVWLYQ